MVDELLHISLLDRASWSSKNFFMYQCYIHRMEGKKDFAFFSRWHSHSLKQNNHQQYIRADDRIGNISCRICKICTYCTFFNLNQAYVACEQLVLCTEERKICVLKTMYQRSIKSNFVHRKYRCVSFISSK